MADRPDPPSPVQLIIILFTKTCQRISEIYSWIEAAAKKIHASIINPIFGAILAVLLTMFGPIGIYVGAILGWIFTFSWLNTVRGLQKYPIFTRFMLSAIAPVVVWTGFGYLAFKATPHYPSTDEIADKVLVGVAKLLSKIETKTESNPKLPEPPKPAEKPKLVLKGNLEAKKLQAGEKQPLVMSLVKPGRFIEWRIENLSNQVVQPVLYHYALWNLDNPQLNAAGPAIQIPVRRIDFINPERPVGGIMNLSSESGRLFGVASINCPGCKERGYWIYIDHTGGWFAEMIGYDTRGLVFPYSAVANDDKEMEKLVPSAIRQIIR
jgi:hypothetical protein